MLSSCVMSGLDEASVRCVRKRSRTLAREVSATGVGVFTGEKVTIRLLPATEEKGIVFRRVDLPGKPVLPAHLDYVQGTPRCTVLGDQGIYIYTVEHLLAALKAMEIHHAEVEISGSEVPIFDGGSTPFVDMIDQAGSCNLDGTVPQYSLLSPVFWAQGNIQIIALPASEYRISYTLHYPQSLCIGTQFHSARITPEEFAREIAPCRTFSVYEEVAPLIEKGLIRGGSLDSAVVIRENRVANPEGLRFPNEMARHKILDLVGDLSLIPFDFVAHIVAIRSGHASNNAFAKELFNHIQMENS